MAYTRKTVVIGVGPDMTEAEFVAALVEDKSPAVAGGAATYRACVAARVLPSYILGKFHAESTKGTNPKAICVAPPLPTYSWGNTTEPSYGYPGLGAPFVRGRFTRYADWAEGGVSTVWRLVNHPPYAKAKTVEAVDYIWAPPTDSNDTEAYIATTVAEMNRWGHEGGAMPTKLARVPMPPITNALILNKIPGVGIEALRMKRDPRFSVVHSMIGYLMGSESHFKLLDTQGLTDFGIGSKDYKHGFAEIRQWCDPFGTIVPWASGPASAPFGDGLRVVQKWGAAGVNRYGVSIETEDQGDINNPMTGPGWSSLCWLLAAIHDNWLNQTADTFDLNCHHNEFTGGKAVGAKDCPFPRIYNHTTDYQDAVKAIMRHFNEGVPYTKDDLLVAGLKISVPTNDSTVKGPTIPAYPATYDAVTGHYTAEQLWSYYNKLGGVQGVGRPRAGLAMYSDGVLRQMFDNLVLEYNPKTDTVRVGGLGIAYQEKTGQVYPEWSTAKPVV